MSALPAQPNFRGTLGAVLVEQGEFEGGIKHLAWSCSHAPDPRNQAYCLAYTAIAHYRQDDHQKANDCLARAVAGEANSYAVRKAQAEVRAA